MTLFGYLARSLLVPFAQPAPTYTPDLDATANTVVHAIAWWSGKTWRNIVFLTVLGFFFTQVLLGVHFQVQLTFKTLINLFPAN